MFPLTLLSRHGPHVQPQHAVNQHAPPPTGLACTTWCSPSERSVRDTSTSVRVKAFCRDRLSATSLLNFSSR